MTFDQFVLAFDTAAFLILLFEFTLGKVMDRITRRREAIQTEAEKHMEKILNGEL